MKTVVSKGEFAKMKGRTNGSVSYWIATGKISKAALVGEGHTAKIWVEQAEKDLLVGLTQAQQGPIKLKQVVAAGDGNLPGHISETEPQLPFTDQENLSRRRAAEAGKAAARRKNMVDAGRWMDAVAAKKEWGAEIAKLVGDIETFICTTLAQKIADRMELDWKTVSVVSREAYRQWRSGVVDEAKRRRLALEACQNKR